jgi:hypothetical protein
MQGRAQRDATGKALRLHEPRDEDRHRDVPADGFRLPARYCARLWMAAELYVLTVSTPNSLARWSIMKRIFSPHSLLISSVFPAAGAGLLRHRRGPAAVSEMLPVPDSPVYYAPPSIRTTSSTTAVLGLLTRPGTRAPGTTAVVVCGSHIRTDLRAWVPIRYYHKHPTYWHGWTCQWPPALGPALGQRMAGAPQRLYRAARTATRARPCPNTRQLHARQLPRAVAATEHAACAALCVPPSGARGAAALMSGAAWRRASRRPPSARRRRSRQSRARAGIRASGASAAPAALRKRMEHVLHALLEGAVPLDRAGSTWPSARVAGTRAR